MMRTLFCANSYAVKTTKFMGSPSSEPFWCITGAWLRIYTGDTKQVASYFSAMLVIVIRYKNKLRSAIDIVMLFNRYK